MEQRKLIKLGNSSFAISLPKIWIQKSGLKKGDEVFIEEGINGEIIINNNYKNNSERKKIIDLSGLNDPKAIEREISLPYIRDYNTMEIIGVRGKKDIVKKLTKNLIGLEIVEVHEDKILLKDFFNLQEANLTEFVRRMDNIIRSMFEDLEMGIRRGCLEQKEYYEIYNADEDVNKFYLLMNRLLVKGTNNPSAIKTLKTSIPELFNLWLISFNLEYTGDELKRIAKILHNEKIAKKEKIKEISQAMQKIKEDYLSVLNSYYKNDYALAFKTISEVNKAIMLAEPLSGDKDKAIAKIGEKLKQIRSFIHQINKIILYSLEDGK